MDSKLLTSCQERSTLKVSHFYADFNTTLGSVLKPDLLVSFSLLQKLFHYGISSMIKIFSPKQRVNKFFFIVFCKATRALELIICDNGCRNSEVLYQSLVFVDHLVEPPWSILLRLVWKSISWKYLVIIVEKLNICILTFLIHEHGGSLSFSFAITLIEVSTILSF